ncbi:hypothetical protein SAMN05216553_108357 [Lentzea fradiae]|uniref:Holin n=1 Tax=Lentzea fradiae TaxID=200378 RepID=A0A1G7UQS4_9PSEU|nr:hypothetical protein [Lentzea fradiae]SDG49873.1 hypothetical protein SAMN05216553_108357 [Lentzea fradiae]
MIALLRREPVLVQATFLALVNLAVAFGLLDLTAEQTAALVGVLAAALGLWTRRLVTPISKLREIP